MEIQTKRFIAWIIDFYLVGFAIAVTKMIFFNTVPDVRVLGIVMFLCYVAYYFFSDIIFKGRSIGKIIMKIHIEPQMDSVVLFAVIHSVLKIFFSFIWMITGIYYLLKKGMPYDRFLYKTMGNRHV